MHDEKNCQEQVKKLKIQLTLEQEHIAQLEKLLNHDPDTGLLQKHVLVQRIRKYIASKQPFALAIIRLDRNYQRIRHTRDRMKVLLYVTSERIKAICGEENLYQSDRSDEFMVIFPKMQNIKTLRKVIMGLQQRVAEYHNPPASDLSFGCHVGATLFPKHGENLEDLLVNTEIALGIYEKKRDHGFIYTQELGEQFHQQEALEMVLIKAVRSNFQGFHLVYQPLTNDKKEVIGCEALLRWEAPNHGSVSPVEFIPLAEKSGMIIYLGRWVLYNATRQAKLWREKYGKDFYVSINVSPIQLQSAKWVESVEDTLSALKVEGEAIHLEITESSVMEEPDKICEKLEQIRKLGIRIMLDDFGTGYSSLSYLNRFPVDTLKIAKEFIDDFPSTAKSKDTVQAILSLAHNFGFKTLAEGVEKQEQFDALIEQGCHYIQGFLFSPPIDPVELEERYLQTK